MTTEEAIALATRETEYSKGFKDSAEMCRKRILKLEEDLRQTECGADMFKHSLEKIKIQRNEAIKRKTIYFYLLLDSGMSDETIEKLAKEKEAIWNDC